MLGEYRLLRTKNGRTAYAVAVVESQPSNTWNVLLNDNLLNDKVIAFFGSAATAGVELIRSEHERHGGSPQHVEVVSLGIAIVDTQPSHVTCAVAIATWKSLGYPESDVKLVFDGSEWGVEFQHSHNQGA